MNQFFRTHTTERETLEARVGLRLAARLNTGTAELPHDISTRLRFARERALEHARLARQPAAALAPVGLGGTSTLVLGGGPAWRWRLASMLPVALLLAGLVTIQMQSDDELVFAAAEVDAALLADDLPPSAYADAGFAEFLRAPHD
jgi:hypothetical protein